MLPAGRPVISAAKGIEQASGLFTTEIIAEAWPGAVPAILSGPSFAADIGRGPADRGDAGGRRPAPGARRWRRR